MNRYKIGYYDVDNSNKSFLDINMTSINRIIVEELSQKIAKYAEIKSILFAASNLHINQIEFQFNCRISLRVNNPFYKFILMKAINYLFWENNLSMVF